MTRDLPGRALERLGADHEVEVRAERGPAGRDWLTARLGDVEGLLSMLTDPVDAAMLAAAPRLRAVANYAVGWDNVDVPVATRRGVPVGNTPDVLTDATADLAFALMLAAARRIVEADAYVRAGEWTNWEPDLLLGLEVRGSTLGIVGRGRIGSAMARRAEGFGMEVISWSPRHGVPFEELLARSDFVSLHAPLTEETRHLIDARALGLMKPGAVLVNTARGPLVDTDALARALHDGALGAAALDVTDPEPLPGDHPLLEAPHLLVVPHIGSATRTTREAMADRAVDNLLAALAGRPMPHCVNPEVYDRARGPAATRPSP